MSNELIYEIFEYFDFCHAYKIFFNLNTRFRNLLINSIFPIRINFSCLSKSSFEFYYKNIIIPYQDRIQLLHLSNPFIIDLFLSSFSVMPKLIQLQTFIIDRIPSKYLQKLLNDLFFLPHLSSLILICTAYVPDRNNFYKQIFRLPYLKYCKLSIHAPRPPEQLASATNEYSPIERLVIKDDINFHELSVLLSYVPQLHRLSIDHLIASNMQMNVCSIVPDHLTHVYFNLHDGTFDDFEILIKNFFHQIQVLSISTPWDRSYLDANRWKQLILSYMPHLRVFDIQYYVIINTIEKEIYANLFDQFYSSFWFDRQWFFLHIILMKGDQIVM